MSSYPLKFFYRPSAFISKFLIFTNKDASRIFGIKICKNLIQICSVFCLRVIETQISLVYVAKLLSWNKYNVTNNFNVIENIIENWEYDNSHLLSFSNFKRLKQKWLFFPHVYGLPFTHCGYHHWSEFNHHKSGKAHNIRMQTTVV